MKSRLIIQKFGGTSVGSVDRIFNVAKQVLQRAEQGIKPVVVVSAMSGETNRLVDLAKQIDSTSQKLEYDMLLASGEQVSAALVSMAINKLSGSDRARPYLGHQIGIITDSVFSKARIETIKTSVIKKVLSKNIIPVIAGFQGVDSFGNITTLGRGGSDTSAVAIAIALKADECEIYTDVDGVYTTDPRIYDSARKIKMICFEEMMELASLGAKVLQIRSVELAAKFNLIVHVRSSFNSEEGTRVVPKKKLKNLEEVVVSGIAADLAQSIFTVSGLGKSQDSIAKLFSELSKKSIVVDVIILNPGSDGTPQVSFTVHDSDANQTEKALHTLKENLFPQLSYQASKGFAKVSIVGVGMQHHPGVASKMFELLAQQKISIALVSTSEIKVSCLIRADQAPLSVKTLHQGFGLG